MSLGVSQRTALAADSRPWSRSGTKKESYRCAGVFGVPPSAARSPRAAPREDAPGAASAGAVVKVRPYAATVAYHDSDGRRHEEVVPIRASDHAAAKDMAFTYAVEVLRLKDFELRVVSP